MRNSTFLKSLFLLCALIVGCGTAWADNSVNISPTQALNDGGVNPITVVCAKGDGSSNPAISSSQLRLYQAAKGKTTGNTITFSSENTITKIVFTFANNMTADNGEFSTGSYDSATSTWTGSTNSVTLTVTGRTSGERIYITAMTVYYQTAGKTDVELSFPEASYQADIAEGTSSFSAPTATANPAVTGITYSSSNTAVATVNETTGAVTLVKRGTTTITATFAGDQTYNRASASYTLTVTNSNGNDGSEAKPFTVEEALEETPATGTSENYYIKGIVSGFYGDDIMDDGSNYRYYISDDGTKTNQLLVYKGKGLNDVAFTAATDLEIGDEVVILGGLTTYNSTKEIAAGNYIVSRKTKADPALTVVENVELYVGQQKAVSEFYLIEDDYAGVVSFESSDETVAKVEGDVLKALAVGTAVITVTAAADANYKTASETFTVTVKSMDVTPEGSNASSFVKVTKTSDITDGQYLIVYEGDETHAAVAFDGSLETLDATNNGIDVTLAGSKIAATNDLMAATFYIDVTNGTLQSASDKYIGVSSNSNGLKQTDVAETYKNSFTIDESGNAVIAAVFDGSAMTLRYNYANNQQRFRYYSNAGQQPIALYKLTETNTFDITIKAGFDGYRTLVSAVDAMLPKGEGLKAYIVTKVESGTASGTATLTEVPTIKANTPYILKGTAGETYTLTGAEGVPAPEGNLLKISDSNTGNGVYVLAKPAGKEIGFYKWTGGSLGAGRVYLDTTTAAPDFIGLGSETTGIAAVTNNAQTTTGGVYNLQGQRVSQPTKGLFIVNGKKVVVK